MTNSYDYEIKLRDWLNGTKEIYEIGNKSPCAIKALRNEESSHLIIGDDSGTMLLAFGKQINKVALHPVK